MVDPLIYGARCSSVVRAFAHGAVGRRIDPSWSGPIELFLVPASAPCVFIMLSKMELCGNSVCSWCDGSLDRSFMVNP